MTAKAATPLRFRRGGTTYRADGAENIYVIVRPYSPDGAEQPWRLRIYDAFQAVPGVLVSGDLVETDTHDLLRLAKATANAYEALGVGGYRAADHGGRNRLTVAIDHAYAADAAR